MKVDPASGRRRDGQREGAVLLGLKLPRDPASYDEPLEELARLADTAGVDALERVVQNRAKPDASTYVGSGKAKEVGALAMGVGATLVIVDHDLSPSQARNLEKLMGLRVVDRTELILDIFATRARSAESRAQVELAQMEYSLPRLKRLWTHLNRETASGKAGVGLRGPGERQLEIDRRLVRLRIRDLKRELEEMQARRRRRVEARSKLFSVAFVGYTNAGKSTLMRKLTGADVLVEDRLFATLDTTTRSWDLRPGRRVYLSDTVGFIRDLPHHLVASFLTTLEEARRADLLLHVVDAHDPDALSHVDVVDRALADIGAGGVPRVLVLNQVDRVREPLALRVLRERLPDAVLTSAVTGEGLDELADVVVEHVLRRARDVVVEADPGNGRLLARLREWGDVVEVTFPDARARVVVRLAARHFENVRREGGTILEPDGTPVPAEERWR
ncbi:MAG TPA: GTPase HflX [Planctomycetota bacterium]|nr:GTPase HflX [Planctomycetota bacterium]